MAQARYQDISLVLRDISVDSPLIDIGAALHDTPSTGIETTTYSDTFSQFEIYYQAGQNGTLSGPSDLNALRFGWLSSFSDNATAAEILASTDSTASYHDFVKRVGGGGNNAISLSGGRGGNAAWAPSTGQFGPLSYNQLLTLSAGISISMKSSLGATGGTYWWANPYSYWTATAYVGDGIRNSFAYQMSALVQINEHGIMGNIVQDLFNYAAKLAVDLNSLPDGHFEHITIWVKANLYQTVLTADFWFKKN